MKKVYLEESSVTCDDDKREYRFLSGRDDREIDDFSEILSVAIHESRCSRGAISFT